MKIKNITVKSYTKDGFDNLSIEGVRHFKELPVLSVVQAINGCYSFGLNGAPLQSTQEGGFFIAPAFSFQEIVHHAGSDGKMSARWIFLDVSVNDTQALDNCFSFPIFPNSEMCKKLNAVFNSLFATQNVLANKIDCYRILQILLENATPKEQQNPHIAQAMQYMQENFKNKLCVADIARAAGVSPSRLYAIFQTHTKNTPMAYLNNLRLSRGCFLLENTNQSINEIAESCGISDPFYFSKMFKNKYGLSPTQYKKQAL